MVLSGVSAAHALCCGHGDQRAALAMDACMALTLALIAVSWLVFCARMPAPAAYLSLLVDRQCTTCSSATEHRHAAGEG